MSFKLENRCVRYVIGADGRNLEFVDTGSGVDHLAHDAESHCAVVKKGGREYGASAVEYAGGKLSLKFGRSRVSAVVRVTVKPRYFVFDVESVSGDPDELVFVNIPTTLRVTADEPFSAGTLGLNLQTNVEELPGPQSHPWAACYRGFGLVGAKAGLVTCAYADMREALKGMVTAAPDVPHSSLGGPWAMDSELPYGSYLFGAPTEQNVDGWIDLCRTLGFTQIDFCGSLNYGDYQPFPQMYPSGRKSVKAVIDKLHQAGILAGLHTMSFSIDKRCAWVTPKPDPRLAKERTYTLSRAIGADDTALGLVEPTTELPKYIGYLVRRSMTLQIDDELIEYSTVTDGARRGVSGCKRGACGTQRTAHAKGAKVHHLKECWGCFLPDGDSTLFTEVANRISTCINECGFDFTYLDGLDGAHVIGGEENRWHYGTKFAFEVYRKFKRPTMMEMATFHHHLWFVRSRMQAWDHAVRAHKTFIDIHCLSNEGCRRIFMPRHLGWSRVLAWLDNEHDVTFDDDVEYMWCKGLGTDAGYSLQVVSPDMYAKEPWLHQVTPIVKTYETLRQQKYFPESVKQKLREPGAEFTLVRAPDGEWQFQPMQYARHKVENTDGRTNVWRTHNKFDRQPLMLRIQALMSAGPYAAPDNVVLADFRKRDEFNDRSATETILNSGKLYAFPAAAPGLTAEIRPSKAQVKAGGVSGCWTAANADVGELIGSSAPDDGYSLWDHAERVHRPQKAAWVRIGKRFPQPLDLSQHRGLGVWVYGDGQGELMNFQSASLAHHDTEMDHYVKVDFKGWRYFELIEPDAERFEEYSWPYARCLYQIYRCGTAFQKMVGLNLWYNNVPAGGKVKCYLSPVKALPLVKNKLVRPAVTVNGRTLVFPVEIESGSYLEFYSRDDCRLFGPKREPLGRVKPEGDIPLLAAGENEITFNCGASEAVRPRANVTIISQGGEPLRR
ncbi:MAG: hypothetical protein A3K19_06670 [Lentisphaerae bacterium RIFOXYB12_FULL_65_16]|nr:MAG: hypothetical protein A3K18_00340 [Lentisphaerae bacterium RIFOXYA12_64_32]OGV93122.1 MAG: hypothetical protein A3K19_06670 [Lentisphaerae bacterium RIFOXYB12_FULL_65_16]